MRSDHQVSEHRIRVRRSRNRFFNSVFACNVLGALLVMFISVECISTTYHLRGNDAQGPSPLCSRSDVKLESRSLAEPVNRLHLFRFPSFHLGGRFVYFAAADLVPEYSKEQIFLLQRRGRLPSTHLLLPSPYGTERIGNGHPFEHVFRALPSPAMALAPVSSSSGSPIQRITASDFRRLTVSQLRSFLRERDAACEGCVERAQLAERAAEVAHWPTRDGRIASELTLLENTPTPFYPPSTAVHVELHESANDLICEDVGRNGTLICKKRNE